MSRFTRRQFVGTSAVAASSFAAPNILKAVGAVGPNEKIGMSVVGCGGRGGAHIGGWLGDSRTQITALVEVDETRAAKRAKQVEDKQGTRPKVYRDMREAFDDRDVDAISTATPNHWHALCGVWAMQAGKDAYIEKPVSHDIAEGSALVAAARKYGRICQVGTQSRSNRAVIEAVQFLNDGGIGEVNFARGLCYKRRKSIGPLGDYPIPDAVDFDQWSGPAPYTDPKLTRSRFHYDWHWQRLYGNGDSGNQGPHQTDIARWGLGIDTHPVAVMSYGGRLGYKAERNDPDYVDAGDTPNTLVAIYDYGDKSIVFETRGLSVNDSADEELNRLFNSTRGNKIGVVFYGSEGYLVQRTYSNCIAYDKNMKKIREFTGGGNHFGNFIDAVKSREHTDLTADVREGHLSAAMAHLANISYYVGEDHHMPVNEAREAVLKIDSVDDNGKTFDRTVQHLRDNGVNLEKHPLSIGPHLKFDPEKEVFPESREATAMVTREYREPYVCPRAEDV